jgi:hypothetical protein
VEVEVVEGHTQAQMSIRQLGVARKPMVVEVECRPVGPEVEGVQELQMSQRRVVGRRPMEVKEEHKQELQMLPQLMLGCIHSHKPKETECRQEQKMSRLLLVVRRLNSMLARKERKLTSAKWNPHQMREQTMKLALRETMSLERQMGPMTSRQELKSWVLPQVWKLTAKMESRHRKKCHCWYTHKEPLQHSALAMLQ